MYTIIIVAYLRYNCHKKCSRSKCLFGSVADLEVKTQVTQGGGELKKKKLPFFYLIKKNGFQLSFII